MQELLKSQQEAIDKEYEDIAATRIKVYDTMDELPQELQNMEQKIKKRMVDLGITKDRFREGYFKEFNI